MTHADSERRPRTPRPALAALVAEQWSVGVTDPGTIEFADQEDAITPRGAIALVGRPDDEELTAAATELERRGHSVVRLPAAPWPARRLPSYDPTRAAAQSYAAMLCRGVDYLAPVAYHAERTLRVDPELAQSLAAMQDFYIGEARAALAGWVAIAQPSVLIDDPAAQQAADLKPLQLHVAARLGLSVPKTLISSDPAAIRSFWESCHGGVVYKSLCTPVLATESDQVGFVYTSALSGKMIGLLDDVALHPGCYQERLRTTSEYRVTVLGDQAFVAATETAQDETVDWRRSLSDSREFKFSKLPEEVEQRVIRLVADFGLKFAAVDLAETSDNIYFLELNPTGSYRWLEKALGLPITEAMCNLLTARSD